MSTKTEFEKKRYQHLENLDEESKKALQNANEETKAIIKAAIRAFPGSKITMFKIEEPHFHDIQTTLF